MKISLILIKKGCRSQISFISLLIFEEFSLFMLLFTYEFVLNNTSLLTMFE